MRRISVSEAKAKLSELLRCAEQGETVLIVRHGRAVARLTPPSPWPDGASEDGASDELVQTVDLDALERAGTVRRPPKLPDTDLLERPELALPCTDGLLDAMLRDVEADRDER